MNIAVRTAIKSHNELSMLLKKLSKFASSIKKSIDLSRIHLSKKSQVRCENATRWGSSFLMLGSFLKAYSNGCFTNSTHRCRVSREVIEKYFQILLPVYQLNLHIQKTFSNISEIVPLLTALLYSKLERMELNGHTKTFSLLLIKSIKKKFDYELKSEVYSVAALLDTSKLKLWTRRSFSKKFVTLGLNSMIDVALMFLSKNGATEIEFEDSPSNGLDLSNCQITEPEESSDLFSQMLRSNSEDFNNLNLTNLRSQIEIEKNNFLNLIKEKDLSNHSSSSF